MKTRILTLLALVALLLPASAQTLPTALTGLTTPASGDLLSIYDIDEAGAVKMKKTTFGEFKTALGFTLGGTLTTSGAYNLTMTLTGATSITLPTSGTLATTAITDALDTRADTLEAKVAVPLTIGDNASFAPVDNTDYFFGLQGSGVATKVSGIGFESTKIYVPVSGTINKVSIRVRVGSAGTAEQASVQIVKSEALDSPSTAMLIDFDDTQNFVVTNLAYPVTAGDYIAVHMDSPADWATNPGTVRATITVYIE